MSWPITSPFEITCAICMQRGYCTSDASDTWLYCLCPRAGERSRPSLKPAPIPTSSGCVACLFSERLHCIQNPQLGPSLYRLLDESHLTQHPNFTSSCNAPLSDRPPGRAGESIKVKHLGGPRRSLSMKAGHLSPGEGKKCLPIGTEHPHRKGWTPGFFYFLFCFVFWGFGTFAYS